MDKKDKAIMLLSRAEINITIAEDVLSERHLEVLTGELRAVNNVVDFIRQDTSSAVGSSGKI